MAPMIRWEGCYWNTRHQWLGEKAAIGTHGTNDLVRRLLLEHTATMTRWEGCYWLLLEHTANSVTNKNTQYISLVYECRNTCCFRSNDRVKLRSMPCNIQYEEHVLRMHQPLPCSFGVSLWHWVWWKKWSWTELQKRPTLETQFKCELEGVE